MGLLQCALSTSSERDIRCREALLLHCNFLLVYDGINLVGRSTNIVRARPDALRNKKKRVNNTGVACNMVAAVLDKLTEP